MLFVETNIRRINKRSMKTKIYKILGVALTLVLLASLTVGLAGTPAGADPGKLKFTKLKLTQVGAAGDYWCIAGTDVGVIATSPNGDLFAALYGTPDLMKSTTDGYGWKWMNNFAAIADGSNIVDIVTSKEYEEDETVFVATQLFVYQSVDGGQTWAIMPAAWGANERITDLDVTMDDKGRITLMVCTDDITGGVYAGDVYIYGSKTLTWVPQQVTDAMANTVDVLAGGFSPFFEDDEFFAAVVTNAQDDGSGVLGTTQVVFAITPTTDATPAPWGVTYGVARVRDADDLGFISQWARIAYPDDFAAGGIGNNTIFAGLYAGTTGAGYGGGERGDVYKINTVEGPFSGADDLDIRGEVSTLLPTPTNIVSIDVIGDAADESCHILVGTDYIDFSSSPYYFLTYRSEDCGESWMPSMKAPTGGTFAAGFYINAWTQVLFAYDYLSSGIAYAGTMGNTTSAFSRSINNGNTFNQISLMDFAAGGYGVAWLDATGYNAADTLHAVFTDGNGAVFQTTNAGENWERIFSYANPFVDPNIAEVWRVGDEAIFTKNYVAKSIWRSTDMGDTWLKKITISKAGTLTAIQFVSETSLWIGFGGTNAGDIWWSENSGATWDKPEENPMNAAVNLIFPMGPDVIISTDNGIFFSSDSGDTIDRVGGGTTPGAFGGYAFAFPDLVGFGENHTIFATIPLGPAVGFWPGPLPDAGVWRTEINYDDPTESEWVRIDDNQDSTGAVVYDETTVLAGGPPLPFPPNGILYVVDMMNVDTNDVAGGLWRCTNPLADVDGAHPPYFEKENKGLVGNGFDSTDIADNPWDDDWVFFSSFDLFPTTIFVGNANAANYWEQILIFVDTLDVGVPLASPAADETGVGLLPEGYVYPEVVLAWEEMAGANGYQYQVAIDSAFKTVVANDFTTSLASEPLELSPNTTYYWRVRVAAEGSLIGAPLISPWSETWKFKTAIGASMARPALQAPWPGEPDVPLSPTFEWSGIEWAEVYEYELATDPTTTAGGYFTEPLVALVGTNSLVSTAWKCDITLDYNTRYYWHVKAIGVDTDTPWSDVGTFTTMGVPPEPPTAQPPVVIPPAEQITPAWIWAVVIIGAILVIAVIVLIVTTRRVP
jgi:photosystem II stability/assembly factor-like uncharacterized protein